MTGIKEFCKYHEHDGKIRDHITEYLMPEKKDRNCMCVCYGNGDHY